MHDLHEWLSRWAVDQSAGSEHQQLWHLAPDIIVIVIVAAGVLVLQRMFFGGGGSRIRDYEHDGKKFRQIDGEWQQGFFNSENGVIDTWKSCSSPPGGTPPKIIPAEGMKYKMKGSR